ncbi:hypothetical protein Golob_009692, partial [Gossypium lobatum]|nr:hypothetical protein [Gossypium lobatum]
MKLTGLDPDLVSYNLMLNGLGKSGRVEEALSLFDEMRNRGITPDLYTYNSLILNLGTVGMVEQAGKFYEELQLMGLEPNVFTYNALIRGYSVSGNSDHAYAVYKQMMAWSVLLMLEPVQRVESILAVAVDVSYSSFNETEYFMYIIY